MSRRDNAANRCEGCALHRSLCICEHIRPLDVASRLCLVIHRDEVRKPTNTGRLAAKCLAGSEVRIHGRQGQQVKAPWLDAPGSEIHGGLLLYPGDGAEVLSEKHLEAGPVRLVVPDGNWRGAAKMTKRIPWIAALPRVVLPDDPATNYRLRHEPKAGGLATMEAIAHAFSILEGPAVSDALFDVFRRMVDRTLYSRGQLAREDVYGGIPDGVERHKPA